MRGWTIAHEYIDHGWSGAKESRPALDELCARLRAPRYRHFDAVCVWKFDRFARSTRHLVTSLEKFQSLKVPISSASQKALILLLPMASWFLPYLERLLS